MKDVSQILDDIHPDDREQLYKAIDGCCKRGDPIDLELRDSDGQRMRHCAALTGGPTDRVLVGCTLGVTPAFADRDGLIRERDEALEATERKNQLIASIAHEVRTSLNAIVGYARILGRSELLPAESSHVRTIHSAGTNLLLMLNDILDMAKIDAHRMPVDADTVDIGEMVTDVKRLFAAQCKAKAIRLRTHLRLSAAHVGSDRTKLRQVLINLVSNAVKFTDRGRIEISVTTIIEDECNWILKMLVSDTGRGISSVNLDTIFDDFTVASRPKPNQSSTGIGLPLSRQLCRLLGGDIQVESRLGRGTTFSVTIPVEPLSLECRVNQASADGVGLSQHRRVLVLGRNEDMFKHLSVGLSTFGWAVDHFCEMEAALKTIRAETYDVSFIDAQSCQPPDIDRLISELRSAGGGRIVRIATDHSDCRKHGADALLHPPLDDEALRLALQQAGLNIDWRHPKQAFAHPIDPCAFQGLSTALRQQIGIDAAQADLTRLSKTVSDLWRDSPRAAAALQLLLERFDYGSIQRELANVK